MHMQSKFKKKSKNTTQNITKHIEKQIQSNPIQQLLTAIKQPPSTTDTITLQLILKSSLFWDTKSKRVDKIKSLILSGKGLKKFQDIQQLKIEDLTSIELLSLSKNQIEYISGLSCLQTLICLNINNNKIVNITPINNLIKLEQFYGNNNLITNVDVFQLGKHQKLRILNIFGNKIQNLTHLMQSLAKLINLEEFDVENNPIWNEDTKKAILQQFPIKRLNGEIVTKAQRQQFIPNQSFIATSTSFRKNQSTTNRSHVYSHKKNMIDQVLENKQKLEMDYLQIDEQFENQIVKNVQLKKKIRQLMIKRMSSVKQKEQKGQKQQQLKLLKRKVKQLKENLFNNNGKKGQLLRNLFQIQVQLQKNEEKNQPNLKMQQNIWVRKFDADQVILIQENLNGEDKQLEQLLKSNDKGIQQLRKQLAYLTDD